MDGLADALDFSRAIGTESGKEGPYERGGGPGVLGQVDFFTRSACSHVPDTCDSLGRRHSHEALMLDYEQAMTRKAPLPGDDASKPRADGFYNTSAHFLWVGDRTRQLDGAHIEYVRGIRNPIGIKVGPSLASEELTKLLEGVYPAASFPFSTHHSNNASCESRQRARASHPDHEVWCGQGKL